MKQLDRLPRAARGISLVEIMVAMAIGLVVVGTVLSTYLHSKAGSRQSTALSQVTEDATLAFNILRHQISMADYSQPTGLDGFGLVRRLTGQPGIVGCDGPFASGDGFANPGLATCNATGAGADSLIVRFEADTNNSAVVNSPAVPADCQGTGLVAGAPPLLAYFVSDSRFQIDTDAGGAPALRCRGSGGMPTVNVNTAPMTILGKPSATPGGTTPVNGYETLVNNIQDLQIAYGVASTVNVASPTDATLMRTRAGKRVERYLTASQVGAPNSGAWSNVISVRLCLVARSEEEVLDQITPYHGCTSQANISTGTAAVPAVGTTPEIPAAAGTTTPTDRRFYRAFTTTVVLNNRI